MDDRPANRLCACGAEVKPYWLDNGWMKPRWVLPNFECSKCIDEAENKKRERDLLRQKQIAMDSLFKESRLSPRFRLRTFDTFEVGQGSKSIFDIVNNYKPEKLGLYLFGECGVGKTHLAAAIVNKYLYSIPVLFVSCPELLNEIRNGVRSGDGKLLKAAKEIHLLVLDDIGAEKVTDWVLETLFVLINNRYEFNLPTVFTSNYTIAGIAERLGDRIASRIVEMCKILPMGGGDYRLKKKGVA